MSLTTAISDDEIDHSSSPVSTRPINSAASFNCTGAVRKAGFLSVKKWIIRKKHKVELARKRGWKGYWVCLKGIYNNNIFLTKKNFRNSVKSHKFINLCVFTEFSIPILYL